MERRDQPFDGYGWPRVQVQKQIRGSGVLRSDRRTSLTKGAPQEVAPFAYLGGGSGLRRVRPTRFAPRWRTSCDGPPDSAPGPDLRPISSTSGEIQQRADDAPDRRNFLSKRSTLRQAIGLALNDAGADTQQLRAGAIFERMLKDACAAQGLTYIDMHTPLVAAGGTIKQKWYLDAVHLRQTAISQIVTEFQQVCLENFSTLATDQVFDPTVWGRDMFVDTKAHVKEQVCPAEVGNQIANTAITRYGRGSDPLRIHLQNAGF